MQQTWTHLTFDYAIAHHVVVVVGYVSFFRAPAADSPHAKIMIRPPDYKQQQTLASTPNTVSVTHGAMQKLVVCANGGGLEPPIQHHSPRRHCEVFELSLRPARADNPPTPHPTPPHPHPPTVAFTLDTWMLQRTQQKQLSRRWLALTTCPVVYP